MNLSNLIDNGWGILMVVLFFGGSIFVHELGHFLAAKWRGLHIERFSIGFGPKIFSWTRGGVEYRLSWLPLGGYVALPQLADMRGIEGSASVDLEAMPPIGYRDKVIVAVAGAVFNIVFAFLLASILFFTGRPTSAERSSTTVGFLSETLTNAAGEQVPAPAMAGGMRLGDKILSVDGQPVKDWEDIRTGIALSSGIGEGGARQIDFLVQRGEEEVSLQVQPIISEDFKLRQIGVIPSYPVIVTALFPDSPMVKAGVLPGDVLEEIDGQPVYNMAFYVDYLKDKAGQTVALKVKRGEEIIETQFAPEEVVVWSDGRTETLSGIAGYDTFRGLVYQTPWEQMKEVVLTTWTNLTALLHRNSDVGISHMSGPAGIIRVIYSAAQYDMLSTIWIVVFINVSLAIFNLLPIPVLDGGHIVFATINKLRGKPMNPNVIASLQGSFMILLFGLMLYVTYFDVTRWVSDNSEQAEIKETRVMPVFGKSEASSEATEAP